MHLWEGESSPRLRPKFNIDAFMFSASCGVSRELVAPVRMCRGVSTFGRACLWSVAWPFSRSAIRPFGRRSLSRAGSMHAHLMFHVRDILSNRPGSSHCRNPDC